ncbi:LysR family transcriptional regulator [Duganella sp. BJB1802]|uniref:LysR substrate-binding domain-containing protein n=1 Tax=Duganella sp. BJB1802 TaxID=2744575 RepID=UPI0015947B61|nr:LysR substrate-binding domain-containing protein [Duganella sp. BJB1802]NVD74876.1 LysR family transcriptional regulator [Duganella sp. BJB1802]
MVTPAHRMPSLTALRCFEAAARLEHFGRAAEALHLTHGAISRAVRALEDDLGVPLFERRSRRVFLTDAGRLLARAVQSGFGVIEQAVGELRAGAGPRRQLVLSCEPTLLMRWLIPRWPAFQAAHPDADFLLVAGGGPFAFDGGIDLAIRRGDFGWPEHFHAHALFAEQVGPVCRPDKAAQWFAPTLRPDAPRLHARSRPDAWRDWARAAGIRHRQGGAGQSFEHFYFSLQAAVAGLGVAIGPRHLVCDDLASGLLAAPLGFVADGTSYYLLSAAPLAEASPQQAVLDWLRGAAADS